MARKKKTIQWIALEGSAQFQGGSIKYSPTTIKEGPNMGQTKFCILRSDRDFQRGSVSFETQLSKPDSRCQLILNAGLEPQVFVGLNFGPYAYGMALFQSGKWEPLVSAGLGDPPKYGAWVKLTLIAHGSSLSLFIDGIKVLSGQAVIQKAQLGLFIHGTSDVEIRNFDVHDQRPKAFIVMQFTDEFNSLYNEVIKRTCELYGYESVRADDIYKSGLIIEDITRSIEESSIIIADITPDNPNVYYEVGYAHGIKKPTILLSEKQRDELPFDVSGFRTLFYENTIGGKSHIEEKLKKHLENIKG